MKKVFDITGMTCAACAAHVEKAVKKLGISDVTVNLLTNRLTVDTDVSDDDIINAVKSAGYGAEVNGVRTESAKGKTNAVVDHSKTLLMRFIASLVFLMPLMWFSMGHMAGFPMGAFDPHKDPSSFALIQLVLTTPVLVINGRFFVGGAKSLLHRSPNMDTLVSLGAGAAYIYGVVTVFLINADVAVGNTAGGAERAMSLFFESAAMILTLVTLGKFLEAKSKGKTRSEVEKLMRLRPQTATVVRDGAETKVAVEEIATGDTVVVLSGEYVPCDGTVLSGATTLDKSAITGESIPVETVVGDKITSAVLNLTGKITIRAEKVGADTTLSKIIELIENAGGSKAPIQKIADKVSAVFVPTVCAIAFVTLIVWLALGYGIGTALNMAISVLVISCPCALGLATPVAVMAGTGRAAAYGVLVKNAETLQSLSSVEIFALDKTATITEGKPRVTHAEAFGSFEKDGWERVLAVAAALEKTSTHPLAKAIIDAWGDKALPNVDKCEYKIGYGVVGVADGTEYALGAPRLMRDFGVEADDDNDLQTTVYLCKRGELLGKITVDDEIKPTSAYAVQLMKQTGARVVMITGDNERQAARIAQKAGIDEVYSNVLPEDKLDIVEKLKTQGRTAMVGDGINDAPALKSADIGIAIGSGTDVAIEAADVVLVRSDLTDVPRAMAVSHASLRNIKQNLFWAFIYNTLGIPLAAGVFYALGVTLDPMIAAGAMAASSLFVVCNALRLTVMRFGDDRLKHKLGRLGKKRKNTEAPSITAREQDASCRCDAICKINQGGGKSMKTVFKVGGMSCGHCSARVEKAIAELDSVESVSVDLATGSAEVVGNVAADKVIAAVKDAGYDCDRA